MPLSERSGHSQPPYYMPRLSKGLFDFVVFGGFSREPRAGHTLSKTLSLLSARCRRFLFGQRGARHRCERSERAPGLTNVFLSATAFVILFSTTNPLSLMLNVLRKRRENALFQMIERLLSVTFLVAISQFMPRSLSTALPALSLATALGVGAKAFALSASPPHKELPGHPAREKGRDYREMLSVVTRFGAPYAVWGLAAWLQSSSERWVILSYLSTKDVGIFALMTTLATYAVALPQGVISQFVTPLVYERFATSNDAARCGEGIVYLKYMVVLLRGSRCDFSIRDNGAREVFNHPTEQRRVRFVLVPASVALSWHRPTPRGARALPFRRCPQLTSVLFVPQDSVWSPGNHPQYRVSETVWHRWRSALDRDKWRHLSPADPTCERQDQKSCMGVKGGEALHTARWLESYRRSIDT